MTDTDRLDAPTREELITLCERAVVAQDRWYNRDTAGAQKQAAEAGALLRSGCAFQLDPNLPSTDETWWIEITYRGFDYFEIGRLSMDTFYIPTAARLDDTAGEDWY